MRLDANRVLINDDNVIIDSDFGAISIYGRSVAALASKVVPLLDGRDAEKLLSSFEANEARDVQLLLDVFERSGLLWSDDSAVGALPPLMTLAGGSEALSRLRNATVGVVCGSSWADDVIAELASAGVRVTAVKSVEECDRLNLLVVIADSLDVETHRRSASWAQQQNIAALHGSLSPAEIVVGPLFRRGCSACWNCARFRRIANELDAVAAHTLDKRRIELGAQSYRHSEPLAKITANLLVLEVLKVIALKAESLLSRLWIFSPLTLTAASHLVLPLPSCEVCGGARTINRAALFSINLDSIQNTAPLQGAFPGWIDSRTGVINAAWFEGEDMEAGPYFVRAQLSAYANSKQYPRSVGPCGGKGINRIDAIRSGIGETLERYSAGCIDTDRLHYAAIGQLLGDVLSPSAIGLYAPSQYDTVGFPFLPFDPQRKYHWIRGFAVGDRTPVWLPAELTFFLADTLGDQLCQVTTSGLALGRDIADASARALLELVERDATMMTWLCRLPAHPIVLDQSDDTVDMILRRLKPVGVDVEFYLLDVDIGIPTVLACGFGDGRRWPGLCVGSAAHSSARAALRAAALEMAYTAQGLLRAGAHGRVERPEAIRSDKFIDHALYYISPERADAAAFLRNGSSINYSILPEVVASDEVQMGAILANAGIGVAIADVTSPDVALGGVRVVRALSDGLLPIHCGCGFPRHGSRRLKDRLKKINPHPHPFC